MSYKPNSPEGAKYPACLNCNSTDKAIYVADPIMLASKNSVVVKRLPKNANREQYEEATMPGLLCADCAEQNDVKLLGELPWPPPV